MKKTWIISISFSFLIAIILIQSLVPQIGSNIESIWLTRKVVQPLLELMGIRNVTHAEVRKTAHVIEYFILSIVSVQIWKGRTINAFFTGFTTAFLDESIQLFTDRSPEIKDIWIDLIGVSIGVIIGSLIWRRRKHKKTRENLPINR